MSIKAAEIARSIARRDTSYFSIVKKSKRKNMLNKKEHRGNIDEPKWPEIQSKRDRTLGEVIIQLFAHENNIDIDRLVNSYKGMPCQEK